MIETRNKKGKLISVQLTEEEQYQLALKNNKLLRECKRKELEARKEEYAKTARCLEEILSSQGQDEVPEER